MERVQYTLHGLGHGVVAGKAVFIEQRIENRLGYQVLGEHFDNLAIADAVVEVVAQLGGEGVESGLFLGVGRVLQNALDAVDMGAGDLSDVVCPVFPMVAVATLLDDLGVDGLLDFTDLVGQLGLLSHLAGSIMVLATYPVLAFTGLAVAGAGGFLDLLLGLVGDGDDFHFARV
ncbi:hypothetical protein FQZ97_827050 [compost metagenome]